MNFFEENVNSKRRILAESGKMSKKRNSHLPKKIKLEKQSSESPDENSHEELYFNKLFENVSKIIQQTAEMNEDHIRQAVIDIKKAFSSFKFTSIDFNKMENLYAYFVHYSPLNLALSRNRFLDAIKNCKKLENRIKKLNINIISLGGGPGTDIIGFCSALQECSEKTDALLNLTVVELWSRWASFYSIIEFLLREGHFGYASKLFQQNNVNTSFMKVDLRDKTPPKTYNLDLKSADIVLLVRVLDAFNFNTDNRNITFENIAKRMKKDALLLLVDSGAGKQESIHLEKIYLSELQDFQLENFPSTKLSYYPANNSKAEIAVFKK